MDYNKIILNAIEKIRSYEEEKQRTEKYYTGPGSGPYSLDDVISFLYNEQNHLGLKGLFVYASRYKVNGLPVYSFYVNDPAFLEAVKDAINNPDLIYTFYDSDDSRLIKPNRISDQFCKIWLTKKSREEIKSSLEKRNSLLRK